MKKIKRRGWVILAAILLLAGLWRWGRGSLEPREEVALFQVRRGPLDITVLEGGSIQALESQEAKCEVRVGYQGTKILKIVEEGYLVTDQDVTNGKALVELDSSEIQKQVVQQEIQWESAAAALTEAQQGYEIQINQNQSDVKAAEQKARFARLDFDKLLGSEVSEKLINQLDLQKILSTPAAPTNAPAAGDPGGVQGGAALRPVPSASAGPTASASASRPEFINFAPFARLEALGDGEAKQKLRKSIDDHLVAQKELEQAAATLEGTKRLFAGGFVTKNDMQRDELAYENSRLKVQTASTARDLYLQYEFIKTGEETLSKYLEALRELDRARKASVSKLAQAEAKRRSAEAQYNVQTRQRKELAEQSEKCLIRAKKPGLVVYGGGDDGYYWGSEGRVREGATVRERQTIITIPDLSRMIVKVSIHESYIKKIKKDQKVRITVDAFPEKALTGLVHKVGVLPDSQNRWLNPDLKVYQTTIYVDGAQDWLKPGMTAKAQIQVARLENVIHIPVQAIVPADGKQTVMVKTSSGVEIREVEVGEFSDEFIEVRKGLSEGEKVLLKQSGKSQAGEAGASQKTASEKSVGAPAASPAATKSP
ncbi:MAG: HlyD family efflux transporter periplasmic adaptor subunit [Verrucomicrobia bacterium]|nr:HlyD family efflux transporter periplasmic adaptor subunit [Verrucomicrobiota bacterium]MBI3868096.1 HlyD family efflux transporter periplasmic adaptor subunit [Verrucomicrobiota bacterium]